MNMINASNQMANLDRTKASWDLNVANVKIVWNEDTDITGHFRIFFDMMCKYLIRQENF